MRAKGRAGQRPVLRGRKPRVDVIGALNRTVRGYDAHLSSVKDGETQYTLSCSMHLVQERMTSTMQKFNAQRWAALVCAALVVAGSTLRPCAAADAPVAPTRILGILGGMGPEATANLYQEIVKLTPAQKDQDHIPTLIFSFPQIPDRTTAIRNNDRSIIPYLVEGTTRLEKAGASFIVLPCNTVHFFHDDMQRAVKIPILHMIRETADVVARSYPNARRIGLLASDGTVATGLYEREFSARGMKLVYPDEPIQKDCVMKAIYGIKAGGDKQSNEELLFTAGKNVERKGAEVIVLGCTEIPLAFNPQRASVPVINATRVLAEAAIREYFREEKKN